jgi:hypothetical protein
MADEAPTLPFPPGARLRGKCNDRLFEDLPPKRGSDDAPLYPSPPAGRGERVGRGGPTSWFVAPPTSPSQPCGWAPPSPP